MISAVKAVQAGNTFQSSACKSLPISSAETSRTRSSSHIRIFSVHPELSSVTERSLPLLGYLQVVRV